MISFFGTLRAETTKIILATSVFSVVFISCHKKKKYRYIEIVQEKYLSDKIIEKDTEMIEAKDDTSAYLKAYSDFCISQKSQSLISEAMKSSYDSATHFKLLTDDGIDLVKTLSFPNRSIREEEIRKSVASPGESTAEDIETVDATTGKSIAGLAPVDVYLNMEKQGFETTKNLSSSLGNTWENRKSIDGIDYKVLTYSNDIRSVESVKADILALPPKSAKDAIQFFKYVSSLPYEGSNPQKAAGWIEDNYNQKTATTTIGKARFSLHAPSDYVRIFRIEKF